MNNTRRLLCSVGVVAVLTLGMLGCSSSNSANEAAGTTQPTIPFAGLVSTTSSLPPTTVSTVPRSPVVNNPDDVAFCGAVNAFDPIFNDLAGVTDLRADTFGRAVWVSQIADLSRKSRESAPTELVDAVDVYTDHIDQGLAAIAVAKTLAQYSAAVTVMTNASNDIKVQPMLTWMTGNCTQNAGDGSPASGT